MLRKNLFIRIICVRSFPTASRENRYKNKRKILNAKIIKNDTNDPTERPQIHTIIIPCTSTQFAKMFLEC